MMECTVDEEDAFQLSILITSIHKQSKKLSSSNSDTLFNENEMKLMKAINIL
jgi:hypothetical protein